MIYFDNSATTPLCDGAKKKIIEMLDVFGNPSSLHSEGLRAEREITFAREAVADSLALRTDEVFFTSSGTEADNIAILSSAKKNAKVGKKIIITNSEHPAVEKTASFLEGEGYEVVRLSTRQGELDMQELKDNLSANVALVSVMSANNETGALYDVASVAREVKKLCPRALVHSDCVQSYMKQKISLDMLSVDLISVSAHKVHAPKGTGALIVKKGLVLPPHTFGGGQESALRSGTENTIGIAAFGAAVRELNQNKERLEYISSLYDSAVECLGNVSGVSLNLPKRSVKSVLNLSMKGYRSEIVLHALSSEGIFVSSGSACSSKKGKSPVLSAFGLDEESRDSALRISFSHYNTKEEICELAHALEKIRGSISRK